MISILIVEDDVYLQKLYELMLDMQGYEVIAKARNGNEAIEIFKSLKTKPDIILMDHRMPIKNGIETTIELTKINSNSNIIFISADNSVKNQALSIGAKVFIEKPFSIEQLHQEIKNVITNTGLLQSTS
ncbi:MAG: response regulator [Candidatus Heimdallarchaeota archaeon]